MADIDYDKLADAVRRGQGGNSGASASKTSDGGIVQTFGDIVKAGSPLYFGFQRLTTQTDALQSGFGAIAGAMKTAGLTGLGSQFAALGEGLSKNKTQLDEAGKIGVGGNNIGRFTQDAALAGQTTQQYTKTLTDFDGKLNGLAGTADRSARTYSAISQELQASDTGKLLKQAGIGATELAEATALSLQNSKRLNLADEGAKKSAMNAAAELALQMNETSRVTGMNRDSIVQSVKAEQDKPKVMLAMLQMSQEQRQEFTRAQASMAPFGKGIQSLASEILTGGIRTKEGIAKMTALGPAGQELEQALKSQQATAKNGSIEEKAAAQRRVEAALAGVTEYQKSAQYAEIANTATGDTAEAMAQLAGENKALMGTMAEMDETGKDAVEATKAQKAEALNVTKGLTADGTARDKGQQATIALNQATEAQRVQAAGLAINLKRVNDELGSNEKELKKFRDTLGTVFGKEKDPYAAAKKQETDIKDIANKVGITGGTAPQTGVSQSGTKITAPPTPGKVDKKDTRDVTTLGATGSIFEPKDFFGKVAKGEGVFSPEQVKNIMQGGKDQGINEAINTMSRAISAPTEKASATVKPVEKPADIANATVKPVEKPAEKSGFDFGGIFSNISTTISSTMPKLGDMFKSSVGEIKPPTITPPVDVSKVKDTSDDEDARRRAQVNAAVEEARAKYEGRDVSQQQLGDEKEITIKDLHTALMMLNKQTAELVQHSENSVNAQEKIGRLTGKASGNRALA